MFITQWRSDYVGYAAMVGAEDVYLMEFEPRGGAGGLTRVNL
jgi:hypothetical protein